MSNPIPLSVLDLVTVTENTNTPQALQRSIRLAQAADQLDYRRYWVAEHHNMPAVASTNPPVIIAALGAHTSKIRVGSGGVMLPNHAPYVVAEQFALLEGLYPNRIDLGLGRAPGTDQRTAAALRRSSDALGVQEFPQHVLELLSWLGDNRLEEPLSASLAATPKAETHPEVWLLGSSAYSAQLAGMLGLRYCYAHHFGQMDEVAVMEAYRGRFEPSPALAEPHAMIATSVITDADAERAEYLAGPAKQMALALRTNRLTPVVSPETAAERGINPLDAQMLTHLPATKFVGTPDEVKPQLPDLVTRTGVQELMLAATTYDVQTRIDTLRDVHAMELTTK
ncbi:MULTISPECIES: LLM class flavin-dependent oxidoreductase [unclassified Luteococcus]|uniref:LLM class flavin-dependent oxidoreductase n=1 Tax=unclassified Luteococcus TaxID=2639923 RepID=UPI00313EBDAD